MQCDQFGLTHFPFSGHAELNGLFQSPSFEVACEQLAKGIANGASAQLLVGESGTGKTTLLTRLRAALTGRGAHVATVSYTRFTLPELIHYLRSALPAETPDPVQDDGEDALRRALTQLRETDTPVVILVDDAEDLGLDALNRLPAALSDKLDGTPLAQLVLAVRPSFVQSLTGPDLDALNSAIDHVCHLPPWDKPTVVDFICAAVQSAAGSATELFTEDALTAIYVRSEGIPRSVINICTAALRAASAQGKRRIDADLVRALQGNIGLGSTRPGESNDLILDEYGEGEDEKTMDTERKPRMRKPDLERLVKLARTGLKGKLPNLPTNLGTRFSRAQGVGLGVIATGILAVVFLMSGEKPTVDPSGTQALAAMPSIPSVISSNPAKPTALPTVSTLEQRHLDTLAALKQLSDQVQQMDTRIASYETDVIGFKATLANMLAEMDTFREASLNSFSRPAAVKTASRGARDAEAGAPLDSRASVETPAAATAALKATSAPVIPATVSAVPLATGSASRTYTAVRGDTLWGIAQRFATSVADLRTLNGFKPNAAIRIGQRLTVPSTASARVTTAAIPLKTTSATGEGYVVQRGDSLYTIGRRFSIPVPALTRWNCIRSNGAIYPGQQIKLSKPTADCPAARG